MEGRVVFPLPRLPSLPASEAASFHLSQQAPRESRLLIGCGEQALCGQRLPGFRCAATAGEAVWTSAVGSVPWRLEGGGDQRVRRPSAFGQWEESRRFRARARAGGQS